MLSATDFISKDKNVSPDFRKAFQRWLPGPGFWHVARATEAAREGREIRIDRTRPEYTGEPYSSHD